MSKRQAAYLSSLLAETPDEAPAPPTTGSDANEATGKSMTLLARDSALARVATGEVKQVTQLLLDPARVRIWCENPRHQAALNETTCRDLIDAILAEGGQKVPAIVRRVSGDPEHEYEVIAGSRRHWVISWLRANNYPEMQFLAQVHALDDEAAFRLSDIENRARKDVSDFERARTYLHALETHYGGKQVRMAERLRLSKGWLSKLLSVAALPDWIVAAFASPADIQLKTCYPLAQKTQGLLQDNDAAALADLRAKARRLFAQQADLRAAGQAGIAAADVLSQLMATVEDDEAGAPSVSFEAASGRPALSVLSSNRNGVSIRLHAGSGASESDLAKMLQAALKALEKQGRGLR